MWSLYVLLLCVPLSLGQGNARDVSEQKDIFTSPGLDVTLHMKYKMIIDHRNRQNCDEFIWNYESPTGQYALTRSHRCYANNYATSLSNYDTSEEGHLHLYRVTKENAGKYTVTMHSPTTGRVFTDYYVLHIHIPMSHVAANISCLPDGSAEASCWVDNESDPYYSWSLDGKSLQGRSISTYSQISLPSPVSGNLTCNVRNHLSDISKSIIIFCPVPLSDPLLDTSCLQNGSTEITCSVLTGTDPSFYLTVNGDIMVDNYTSPQRRVHVTLSSPGPWSINCSVRNRMGEKSATITDKTCPAPFPHLIHFSIKIVIFMMFNLLLISMVRTLVKNKRNSQPAEY